MLDWWTRAERVLAGLLAGTALLFSIYEILIRYFLPQFAYDWGEEVIVYLTIWAVWIATSVLVHEDRHVRADILIRLLPPQAQRGIELFNSALAVAFCAFVIWFSYDMIELSYTFDEQSGSSLRFPMWIYYLSLPVGMALMLMRFLRRIWLFAFHYDPESMRIGEAAHLETAD